jgi:hypothetical protein
VFFFKFHLKVAVEESIVNTQLITDRGLAFFTRQTDEWCVHNRLFNANFEVKFKKSSDIYTSLQ